LHHATITNPEAAYIVAKSGLQFEMAGWDISTAHAVINDELAAEFRSLGTLGAFAVDIQAVLRELCRSEAMLDGFDLRERRHASWWATGEDWVITTSIGTKSDIQNFRSNHFNPLRDAIDPGVTPHSFRHGLATRLLEADIPMRVVAEQLGHSSTRVTEDIYTHVSPGLSRAAAEGIEEVYQRPIGA